MAKIHITLETGTVIAVEDGPGGRVALVTMDPPETGEEGCATCRMCSAKGGCERVLQADAGDNAALSEGARVEVEISRPSLYFPILLTLVVPLVAVVAGAVIGSLVGRGTDWRDLLTTAYAVWVGALGFLAAYRFLKERTGAYTPSAKITRVL